MYISSETRMFALPNGWPIGPDKDPLDSMTAFPRREKSDTSHARSIHSSGFIGIATGLQGLK